MRNLNITYILHSNWFKNSKTKYKLYGKIYVRIADLSVKFSWLSFSEDMLFDLSELTWQNAVHAINRRQQIAKLSAIN